MMFKHLIMGLSLLFSSHLWAVTFKDLGEIGTVFAIAETDPRDALKKAKSLSIEHVSPSFRKDEPFPLKKSRMLTRGSTVYYYETKFESRGDSNGKLLAKSGQTINILKSGLPFERVLVFYDARDAEQLKNLKARLKSKMIERANLRVILTGGSVQEAQKDWNIPVFADQQGKIIEKLGIHHMPAIVEREADRLKITEIGEDANEPQ